MPVPAGPGAVADPDLLATVADLEVLIPGLDEDKALLLLQGATAAVQAAAGGQRILLVTDDEQIIDLDEWDGGLYLDLPQWPVTAVTSATVGATAVTDYSAQLSRGRLWRSYGWRSSTLPYYDSPSLATVVYTHGYPEGDQRLQFARAATLSLASAAYSTPAGVTRVQIDDYSAAYSEAAAQLTAAPALAESLRRRYGRPPRSVRLISC